MQLHSFYSAEQVTIFIINKAQQQRTATTIKCEN